MWKASRVIGEGSDSFPIVEEIEAKKRGIRCAVYSKPLKLTSVCGARLESPSDRLALLYELANTSFSFVELSPDC